MEYLSDSLSELVLRYMILVRNTHFIRYDCHSNKPNSIIVPIQSTIINRISGGLPQSIEQVVECVGGRCCYLYLKQQQLVGMGNESSAGAQPISKLQLSHLGPVTLIQHQQQYCLLKVFAYSDQFLMQDRFRKLKVRTSKLANNPHVLNLHQVLKHERKELCANNFQLLAYLQYFQQTLSSALQQRLQLRKNYTEAQLYQFLSKLVDSLLYIQDNGLKNIHLDADSIILVGEQVKVLDSALASSKTYLTLLQHRQKQQKHDTYLYLAPELLKELEELNYDPYISPKADIFSLGMLLLEMVTLEPMHGYYDFGHLTIDYDSLIHRLSRINHSLPLKTLIAEMLEYDPEERIGLLSLKEKLKRLASPPEQSITRSKSSKMLQEILSHSRRSSSICRQSENSISLSRQPSSEKKSHPKITVRCSEKKGQEGIRAGTQPSAALTSRRQQTFRSQVQPDQQSNLRNLVKNKLNRDRGKAKQNSSRLLRPFKKQIPIFAQQNVLQTKLTLENNSLQSSFFNKKLDSAYRNRKEQEGKASLGGLADQSGVKKLLKLQQLESSSLAKSQQESLKNTSRFGSTEHYPPEPKQKSISRGAEMYVNEEKEDEYSCEIDQFKLPTNMAHKTLNKVMTFNRDININARTVERSHQFPHNSQLEQSLSKLAFSPINSQLNIEPESIYADSGYKSITIKDVPVVISQEKVYQATSPPSHYGNIQRQLNNLEISQSIQQGESLNSSFNNASKVIQAYRPTQDSVYAKAEPLPYEIAAPFKKPKSRKPQLMIELGGEQNSSSPSTLPLALQPKKSYLQNLYKTTQSIEHLSNFTSISPPQENKENQSCLNYMKGGYSAEFQEDFSQKITLCNGQQYEGETLGQLPHGNGVLYSQGKVLFSGSFKFGKLHGYGTLHNNNFEPTLVDYRMIDLTANNWTRFEGEFEEDSMSGFGTVFFSEGEKFSGCLKKGTIEGYGCFYRKNGELISGLWSENKFRKV